MYAEQRRQLLVQHARTHGQVQVGAAAAEFDVTPETIRRDLEVLDRTGILRRVHGGAMPAELLPLDDLALSERETSASIEKERIAHAALALLPTRSHAAILVDAGSTTARLAQLMPTSCDLLVFTNSLPVAATLSTRTACTVELLAGRVKGVTQACVGGNTLALLDRIKVDVCFLGTNGITGTHGLSTPDPDESLVKSRMVERSRRTVVLADASKLGVETTISFCALEDVDVLVTDAVTPSQRTILTDKGIEVVVA